MQNKIIFFIKFLFILNIFTSNSLALEYKKINNIDEIEVFLYSDIKESIDSVNKILKRNNYSNVCLSLVEGNNTNCIFVNIINIKHKGKYSLADANYDKNMIKVYTYNFKKFMDGFPEKVPPANYNRFGKIMKNIEGTEEYQLLVEIANMADKKATEMLNSGTSRYVYANKINLLKFVLLHEIGHIVNKDKNYGFSSLDSRQKYYFKDYYNNLKKNKVRREQEKKADDFVVSLIKRNAEFEKLPKKCTVGALSPIDMVKCSKNYLDEESQIYAVIGMLINSYDAKRHSYYRKNGCQDLAEWNLSIDYLDYTEDYPHSLFRLINMVNSIAQKGSPGKKAIENKLKDLRYLNNSDTPLRTSFLRYLSFNTPSGKESLIEKGDFFSNLMTEMEIPVPDSLYLGEVQKCTFYEIITRCEKVLTDIVDTGKFYNIEISNFKSKYEKKEECLNSFHANE